MPEGGNPRFITAAEVADNYQPKNGGGGIGGSIADKQIAFGNGANIAGSADLIWDNILGILTLGFDSSTGIFIHRDGKIYLNNGVDLALSHSPAHSIDVGDPDTTSGIRIDLTGANGIELINNTAGGNSYVNLNGGYFIIGGGSTVIGSPEVPSAANDTGTAGQIAWDANFFYVCVAIDTWKRAALSTW